MCVRLVLSTPVKAIEDRFYKVGCEDNNSARNEREVKAEAAERCVRGASNLLFCGSGHLICLEMGFYNT